MDFVAYSQTTDREAMAAAHRRHESSIRELSQLGFVPAGILTETTPPLGAIMHLITLPMQLLAREVVRIDGTLRMVIHQPWMVHASSGTHAIMFGRGVKLYTRCSDGRGVVTANFAAASSVPQRSRLDKQGKTMSIPALWLEHCNRVTTITAGGIAVDAQVGFADIVELTRREDPAGATMWLTLLVQTAMGVGLLFYLGRWIVQLGR
ncbi:MAG TPA: hypothetical protein VEB21_04880 [Terriglobales bacterium]|nr:hypothetical protein [Terriglobales bacterium]